MKPLRWALLLASPLLFACTVAPDDDDGDEAVDDAAQAYTSCNVPELRRCQNHGGGRACYDRWCAPSGPTCYSRSVYVSRAPIGECKINTPGQSLPGRGMYLCDTTYCMSNGRAVEQTGHRRNCYLVRCEVGTVCGDALC